MNKTSKKVIFFGNERLATGVTTDCPTLQALIRNGYNVVAIVSHASQSTSRKQRTLEIQDLATKHNIPVLLPHKPADIAEELAEFNADVAVLAAYGKIVPQSVIDIFPDGIINVHPSLLPHHRGSTPIESAILDGDDKTGVSVMQLVQDMDAGPVHAQATYQLDGTESKQDLADTLGEIGAHMVIEVLSNIFAGTALSIAQDEQSATYDKLLTKQDGTIDWSKPAHQIEKEVRAYANWPKSRTKLLNKEVIVHKASVIPKTKVTPGKTEITKDSLVVDCGYNALLINIIQPANKSPMPIAAFLNGVIPS